MAPLEEEEEQFSLVTLQIELVVPNADLDKFGGLTREGLADYLTRKLYEDPEWFGNFGPENITKIEEMK
jgi:hypothetical protein